MAVTLEDLAKIPNVVGVAYGRAKTPGVLGALRGHLVDSLVCDETLARSLLSEGRALAAAADPLKGTSIMTWILLIAAVVAGWMVQMYLTFRQSMAFNREVVALRRRGTVSVGVAGKRYRGGRAFVAIAIDDHGIVRDALTLTGFTTLSRAKPLAGLLDVKTSRILADEATCRPEQATARGSPAGGRAGQGHAPA